MKISFDAHGLIERLKNAVFPKRRAMQKVAGQIKAAAQRNAPVRTGRLRKSINTRVEHQGAVLIVEAATPYARYVEEGTRYMRPRYYMKRAIEGNRAEIQQAFNATAIEYAKEIEG